MSLDFIDLFILASLIQGVFVGFSITTSVPFKSESNNYLGISILTLIIITFFGWLDSEDVWLNLIGSIMWEFVFPVTFFQFVIHSLNHRFKKARWLGWLYLPFGMTLLIDSFFALDFSFQLYEQPIQKNSFTFELYEYLEYNLSFFYNVFLVVWSYKIVSKDDLNNPLRIKWLKRLCIFVIVLLALWLTADNIEAFLEADYFILLWLAIATLFWWVCYYGIYRLRLIDQKDKIHSFLSTESKQKRLNNISPVKNKHLKELERLMVEEELFKDAELSRSKIAEMLGLSEGHLSQLVNSITGKSFIDYITSYRIEAAKEMLLKQEFRNHTFEAIGMEAGFKSRSAFYSAFKIRTNHTPGTFQKLNPMS